MEDCNREYLELLNKKLESLTNMLKATEQEIFTGGDGDEEQINDEADRFAALYEHRANIIASIEKIDEALAAKQLDKNDKAFAKSHNEIAEKITNVAKALVELDKKNVKASKRLTDFLRGNVKKIRDGRGISVAYSDFGSSSGNYYDSKN
jgi:vacuolar-type H+-ATPase subunit I/STV1